MRMPLVSVIIPAYNAARYIHETLDSVTRQSYTNLEIIVVDDGSHDETPGIVENYCRRDARCRLIRQENLGVAAARNEAIRQSRGEYIAPIDSDDIWSPLKIEKQVRCFQKSDPACGLVYCWSIGIDRKGCISYFGGRPKFAGDVLAEHLIRNFLGNASVPLMRRECLDAVGGYCHEFREQAAQGCEDRDLSLRIAEKYTFDFVPEYLVGYRMTPESMSWNHQMMERSYELMIQRLRERRPDLDEMKYRLSRGIFLLYLTRFRLRSGDRIRAAISLQQAMRLHPPEVMRQVGSAFRSRMRALTWFLLRMNRSPRRPFEDHAPYENPDRLPVTADGELPIPQAERAL